jgi:2-keto-4-pentenoate hydratase/2-oxohepta-3-ene-1,7-dioic acid hydratase in catechol pathway
MRLYTFEHDGEERIGAEQDGRIIDLALAHGLLHSDDPFPRTLIDLLRGGDESMALARKALGFAASRGMHVDHALDDVRLRAPIPRPGKILCSGINYRGHFEENPGAKLPETPFFFSKVPSAVIGPGDSIVHPKLTRQLDYEVELAVVIGRTLRRAEEGEAMDAVAGYTILHDVSARDVQFKDNQITLGKNFDTFAPMGPCLVTVDEVPDPGNLRLRSSVNGKVLQDGSTRDWVFPLPRLLASLSAVMTLEPGDVVSTGTPAGVGVFRKPQVFLRPGDVVVLEIEGIGRLENPVVAEE